MNDKELIKETGMKTPFLASYVGCNVNHMMNALKGNCKLTPDERESLRFIIRTLNKNKKHIKG